MQELQIDAWEAHRVGLWVCVLTNGVVNTQGQAVMGRGIALEAKTRFPDMPRELGILISAYGNLTFSFPSYRVYAFPTKWRYVDKADPELIRESAYTLKTLVPPGRVVVLPRPGCGYGGLDYETEVKPILEEVDLPDNIIVIHP
jgi:hypothetical protein